MIPDGRKLFLYKSRAPSTSESPNCNANAYGRPNWPAKLAEKFDEPRIQKSGKLTVMGTRLMAACQGPGTACTFSYRCPSGKLPCMKPSSSSTCCGKFSLAL